MSTPTAPSSVTPAPTPAISIQALIAPPPAVPAAPAPAAATQQTRATTTPPPAAPPAQDARAGADVSTADIIDIAQHLLLDDATLAAQVSDDDPEDSPYDFLTPDEETGEAKAADQIDADTETDEPEADATAPAEESTDTDTDDTDEPAADGEALPANLQKRIDTLVAMREQMKAERDQLREEIDTLRAELAGRPDLPPIVLPASESDPLADLTSEQDVQARLAAADKVIAWAQAHPEGGSIKDSQGDEHYFDAEAVREKLFQARELKSIHGPKRLEYIRAHRDATAAAKQVYPDLFTPGSFMAEQADQFLSTLPEITRHPNYPLFAADWVIGAAARAGLLRVVPVSADAAAAPATAARRPGAAAVDSSTGARRPASPAPATPPPAAAPAPGAAAPRRPKAALRDADIDRLSASGEISTDDLARYAESLVA